MDKKRIRIMLLLIVDILIVNAVYYMALYLRFDGNIDMQYLQVYESSFLYLTVIKIAVFWYFKLYESIWKYASIEEMSQIIIACIVANMGCITYIALNHSMLPRSVYVIVGMLDMAFIGGVRLSYRTIRRLKSTSNLKGNKKRVLVVGGGDAGAIVIKEFKNHKELNSNPVAIIDDDVTKEGRLINGVPVVGQRYDIMGAVHRYTIDEIVIAIPSIEKSDLREIIGEAERTKVRVRILPGIYELIDGQVDISKIRDVQIEDLLGRDQVKLDNKNINEYIENKTVLVTGGGGSIGSELCRQIAKFRPSKLIILDIYENNAYDIQNELKAKYGEMLNLKVLIASVRDAKNIDNIMKEYRPNVVFHAAAHKHVPLMEDSPKEAIKNNVFGTFNVVNASDKYNVNKFVLISTDKAVNPTNIMGASKRLCEMVVQAFSKKSSNTEFVAVRFGNVLGSNGSVIPLFKKQIENGGPITVTHEDIIRYFMTIPEAAQLVIQAGSMAKGGEIFVLDMGEPVKIIDLAKDLIRLSGFEEDEIGIKITGLRPGEKLYEELLMDEEGIKSTTHHKIFIGKPIFKDYEFIINTLKSLDEGIKTLDNKGLKELVSQIVPTYKSNKEVNNKFIKAEIKDSSKEELKVSKNVI